MILLEFFSKRNERLIFMICGINPVLIIRSAVHMKIFRIEGVK